MRDVFESFCHINEATKIRFIRSQYIIEILASVGFSVTVQDVDISNKTIKANLSSNLTFEEFAAVLEHLVVGALRQESYDKFISQTLRDCLERQEDSTKHLHIVRKRVLA